MKKLIVALSAVAIMGVTHPLVAADGDAFSNAKANFWVFANRNAPSATAYAVINYAKGADKWLVTGELMDAYPGTYTLSVGTAGTCAGNFEIVTFTTDGTGYATFGAEIPNDGTFPTGYNIARIYTAGNTCITELTAPAADGSLKFRGLNRLNPDVTADQLQ